MMRGFNAIRLKAARALAGDLMAAIAPGAQSTPPKRTSRALIKTFKQSPWLRAILTRKANDVGRVVWQIFVYRDAKGKAVRHSRAQVAPMAKKMDVFKSARTTGDVAEIVDHVLLDFLDRGNPFLTGCACMRLTSKYLELCGEAFWVLEYDGLGMPLHYWPVPPVWVSKIAMGDDPTYTISTGGFVRDFDARDVVYFRDADPESPYQRGTGTAEALVDELATDEYTAKHVQTWFFNSARPDIIISAPDMNSTAEAERFKLSFLQRFQGLARRYLPFITNRNLTVTQLSQTFENMQLVEMRRFLRDLVFEVFAAPKEIFGVVENSNRSTIDVAEYLWNRGVIDPQLDLIRAELQRHVVPFYDPRIILAYYPIIEEDKEHKRAVMQGMPQAFQVDEIRALAGEQELQDDEGKVHSVPLGVRFVSSLQEEPGPAPFAPGDGAPPAVVDDTTPDDGPPDDEAADSKQIDPRLLRDGFALMDEPWTDGTKDGTVDRAIVERMLEKIDPIIMLEEIAPPLRATLMAFGTEMLAALAPSMSFDEASPIVVQYLQTESAALVKGITDTTVTALRGTLSAGVAEGEAVEVLAKRVTTVFDDARGRRAFTIARTETARASNVGATAGVKQAGIQKKEWLATPDEATRDSHRALNGQTVPVDDKFIIPANQANGGTAALYPLGFGIPEEDINCRCAVLPHFPDPNQRMTEGQRVAHWKGVEANREAYETMTRAAVRRAFTKQEAAALAVLQSEG